MKNGPLADRIALNADVMMGKPTIRGLRTTVEQILRALAAGVPPEDLLEDYPELEAEDLRAVFAFASKLVGETHTRLTSERDLEIPVRCRCW